MHAESRYLSFGGVYVHMRIVSPDEEPATRMLIVSSPLLNSFHWRKLLPELMDARCLTVIVDLPGFGRSDADGRLRQDAKARASMLWGVIDAVDEVTEAPGATWHLCAHGTACPTILKMAEMYPDSVRTQIHLSPLMRLPRQRERGEDARLYDRRIRDAAGFRDFISRLSGYELDDYIVDRMRAPLLRPGVRGSFLHMLHDARTPCELELGFCPAIVFLGGCDPLLTEAARADIDRCLNGAETHLVRDAGHLPMETNSRALRDYVRGWLKYNS